MQISFGLILELMVLVLLATTVGYCFILNKKLQNLRGDEQLLRQTIRELCVSIDTAEHAVDHLRKIALDREQELKSVILSAEHSTQQLRAAQAETLETLALIQQQTNFSLDIANRLKSATYEAQMIPLTHSSSPVYAPAQNAFEVKEPAAPVRRRPFTSMMTNERDAA